MKYAEGVRDLHERGYTEVPGLSVETRAELFQAFDELVENNFDELLATRLDNTGRGYGRGGYRDVPVEEKDRGRFAVEKQAFLYDPAFHALWGENTLSPAISEFVDLCHGAYSEGLLSIQGVARAIDAQPEYNGFASRIIGSIGELSARLTVQRYALPDIDTQGLLFGSHRDTSMLSMHLGDTHPGFYFTDESRIPKPYGLQDDKGVLFVGKQWDAAYPSSDIHAPFHGVNLPEEIRDVRRSSAVLFVDGLDFTRATPEKQ